MKRFWRMFFTLLVLCGITVAMVFGIRACVRNPNRYDHWHIEADVRYVYEGDSAVNHFYMRYDYTEDHGDYDTIAAEFASPPTYGNTLVLYYTYWKIYETGSREKTVRYDTLFYVPDRKFKVVGIEVTASPRKTDAKK